jgi:hypothetical protein
MHCARLNKYDAAGRTGMQGTAAVKALQALPGYPDQQLIVIVCIVSVTAKMGIDTLNAGFLVAPQLNLIFTV